MPNHFFKVVDSFIPDPQGVRDYALLSGFGTWKPQNTIIGYENYHGVNINGHHSTLMRSLTKAMGIAVYHENAIFRVTGADDEPSRIHSDRMFADYTCIVYLSQEAEDSGTAFYRHRGTGAIEQPPLSQLQNDPDFAKKKAEMDAGDPAVWEQVHFVSGVWNRAVIFSAPLYHARLPKYGKGDTYENKRMIWVCHFNV